MTHAAGTPGRSPLRRFVPVLAIALAVVATGLVVRARATGGARGGPAAAGDATACYYDGRPRADCPTPRTGPHADTAWAYAGVIDTLYVRLPGAVGPATLIALADRTVPAAARDGAGAARLAAALAAAAPALPPATARTRATRLAGAAGAPAAPLAPLFSVGQRQRLYDSATARRVVAGAATSKDEALPARGLLAVSRLALDDARAWALVYAERSLAPVRTDETVAVERAYVLLHRLPDGRWRAVRVLPA
jgi:hypothetical protein